MNKGRQVLIWFGLALLLAWVVGCGPMAAPTPEPQVVTQAAADTPQAIVVTVPPAAEEAADAAGGVPGAPVYYPIAPDRKVIKDAEMHILVDNTDVAIDRITGIATQYGGYLIGIQTWHTDGYKEATMVIGVPSTSFEQVLRRVREVATQVERETASGQDVTDQYVDLQSELRNLEATEARLRSFLDKAETVEEALQVNAELARIQGQIEVIKGKLHYIEGRSAISTVTINIRPPRPTPTPTPTPTPVAWNPGETANEANNTLISILRGLWEGIIWIVIVVLPVFGLPAVVILLIAWAVRRWTLRRRQEQASAEPNPTKE